MSHNREDRFQRLLAWLRKGDQSSKKLAALCGMRPKTIQRDLIAMRDERKWPVTFDNKQKTWRLTNAGFYLPLTFASNDDFQAILVLGELVAHFGNTPLGESMKLAFDRILDLFKSEAK